MRTNIYFLVFGILLITSCNIKEYEHSNLGEFNFNQDWEFAKDLNDTIINKHMFQRDDHSISWESISLPHTAQIEPLVIESQQWQGTCFYRKFFDRPELSKEKYIGIRFGAAMHLAEVYLNSEKIATHQGGYLPFTIDLSGLLKNENNCLLVRLNNEDNHHIPPGKVIQNLDFNYYSGIYRNVELLIKNKVHLSNPFESTKVAGGGIMVSQKNVTTKNADIRFDLDLVNVSGGDEKVNVECLLKDKNGKKVLTLESGDIVVKANKNFSFTEEGAIRNPDLWHPDHPVLYCLEVSVYSENKLIDWKTLNIGIRDIQFDKDGFYLNGEKLWLRGTNRHQDYPYIGYALSDNAQYRDAYKIKEAGFNFVRYSHYPHSESFLNACDELGLMVMNAIPGWQFFGDSVFQEASKQDLQDLVRRDRNHPSIILWEASLNESWMSRDFIEDMHQITHAELPYSQIYTCGWMDSIYDVFIPARQHGKPPDYWNHYHKNKPLLIAEYGDWEYYAQNAGFNQTEFADLLVEERTSRQLRGYGQKRLAQQALNYQEAHNDNLNGNHAGDANWLMFDYNRGYAPDIESSGISDIFRIPKFSYYFYQSQRSLNSGEPVLYIANYWNDPEFNDVKVYSNCEQVEIWINDTLIEKRTPDKDHYSSNLQHPPFTFKNLHYQAGTLQARGYVNDEEAAVATRITPGSPSGIELHADLSGKELEAGCNDIIFLYAMILDKEGNPVYDAQTPVFFSVEGDAELFGKNPISAEAGIATILLRAGTMPSNIIIKAKAEGLGEGILIQPSK